MCSSFKLWMYNSYTTRTGFSFAITMMVLILTGPIYKCDTNQDDVFVAKPLFNDSKSAAFAIK